MNEASQMIGLHQKLKTWGARFGLKLNDENLIKINLDYQIVDGQ
jgi:hypothetical protein